MHYILSLPGGTMVLCCEWTLDRARSGPSWKGIEKKYFPLEGGIIIIRAKQGKGITCLCEFRRLSEITEESVVFCALAARADGESMILEQIEVNSRDEYREAQEPKAFTWRGKYYEIAGILDRWYEGYADPQRMPLRYFRVETMGGERFIIRYHELFRAWGIVLRDDMVEE